MTQAYALFILYIKPCENADLEAAKVMEIEQAFS